MLNSSGETEISRLFFLSDFQVKALVDYVHSSGRIFSVYEIATIPGFDNETAEMLIPFVTLISKEKTIADPVRWSNSTITNLSLKTGNDYASSPGSPWKILTKYKFVSGNFSGGFTAEKDQGEIFFPVPDFLSANITYKGNGMVRKIIAGDFSARFGQGTNINTGISTGLSLSAPGYMSASDEIKPFTSTDENNFFRGVAGEFSFKDIDLFLFFSKNHSDATLGFSSDNSDNYIENFYKAGLHNTSLLMLKKDVITEQTYGINASYNFTNIRIGATLTENMFSLPVRPDRNDPENIFDFEGDKNRLFSVYYNSIIKRILLFGEFSINNNCRYAFVQGLSVRPSDRLTINFLFRNYDPGYFSLHGKGPGISSSTGNELGMLGNFTFEAAKHLFVTAGYDFDYYPWLRYRLSSPSWGSKAEVRIKYLPTDKITVDASINYKLSITDNSETVGIAAHEQTIFKSIRGSARYAISDNLILGTRIDYKFVTPSGSKGMLLLQDINYRFRKIPLSIWFRNCLFSTDDWDSRIYVYENDLLYSFSIPALSGEGSRSYIMVKWEIKDIAEIRVKYGITSQIENSIDSKETNEIKIQFKVWF